uniref:Uncharacterized protein n=1 Tax=Anguilla anguilla TaxID=7936 RepID=A0A0E9U8W0_ANGAN
MGEEKPPRERGQPLTKRDTYKQQKI